MKKKFLFSLLVLSLIIGLTGCGKKSKDNPEQKPTTEEPQTIEEKMENGTVEQQGDFVVSNVKIEEFGAESVVSGTITNRSSNTKSVTVLLKMLNTSTSQLFGIVNVDIDDINPGEMRDFSLSMVGDYSNVDYFDVTVIEK